MVWVGSMDILTKVGGSGRHGFFLGHYAVAPIARALQARVHAILALQLGSKEVHGIALIPKQNPMKKFQVG